MSKEKNLKLEVVLLLEEPTDKEKIENTYCDYFQNYQPENLPASEWLPPTYEMDFKSKSNTPKEKADIVNLKTNKSLTLKQIRDLMGYFESKNIWAKTIALKPASTK